MSKPIKIIIWSGGILVGFFLIFICIGLIAPATHHGSETIRLSVPPERVWELLTDIEGIPQRRPEITTIEIIGINDQGYKMWRENTDRSGFINFEITEEVSQEKVVMHMNNASFGMTGQWVYELKPSVVPAAVLGEEIGTDLTITEDSTTNNLFVRALMTIVGRNSNIKEEFKSLKKVL
jgi:uncharacterized protein YndB with AHSA1/START domain